MFGELFQLCDFVFVLQLCDYIFAFKLKARSNEDES